MNTERFTIIERIEGFKDIMTLNCAPIYTEEQIDRLCHMGFFDAPASTKYHGAYAGGLFDHSANVTIALLELSAKMGLKWRRAESPLIIGMYHDLCKCDQYAKNKAYLNGQIDVPEYEYNKNTLLKGHGNKSAMLAATLTDLTEEEVCCIVYHMGAFTEKEEWTDYTGAIHRYPNVLWTHTADMMAAHITEV